MNIDDSLERFGLIPDDASLPAIRQLLDNEARLEYYRVYFGIA